MSRPMVDISKRNRDRILPSLRYNLIFKILEHFLLHNFDRDQTLTEITKNFLRLNWKTTNSAPTIGSGRIQ